MIPANLFTPAAAEARDIAISRVERNASREWMAHALHCLEQLCKLRERFTTDDLLMAAPSLENCREPRALGAVMRLAQRRGICYPTGDYAASSRAVSHARPKRVWAAVRP